MNDIYGELGNALDLSALGNYMAETEDKVNDKKIPSVIIRKGERIPRRNPPQFKEASSLSEAISRDGIIGTAMDDKNQYGPVVMMLLLLVVASITGFVLKLFS